MNKRALPAVSAVASGAVVDFLGLGTSIFDNTGTVLLCVVAVIALWIHYRSHGGCRAVWIGAGEEHVASHRS